MRPAMKATISKRISRLEDRLGARLLNRTTRRLSLTEVGSAFHEHCSRLVAEAEEAEQTVMALTANPRGTFRVNVPMSFGRLHIAGQFLNSSRNFRTLKSTSPLMMRSLSWCTGVTILRSASPIFPTPVLSPVDLHRLAAWFVAVPGIFVAAAYLKRPMISGTTNA